MITGQQEVPKNAVIPAVPHSIYAAVPEGGAAGATVAGAGHVASALLLVSFCPPCPLTQPKQIVLDCIPTPYVLFLDPQIARQGIKTQAVPPGDVLEQGAVSACFRCSNSIL